MKSHSLAAVFCCLGATLVASPASAVELYTNGPYITNPGAHVPSGDVSLAQDQTYAGYTALGINAGPLYRSADDFIVPGDHIWTITGAVLYAYQTGTAGAAFTDARVIIWRGEPDGALSVKLFDGDVSNTLVSSTPDAYRSAQSFANPFADTQRWVQSLAIAIPPLELTAGQYWIDWQLTGPQAGNSVYTPPVSILGTAYTSAGGLARFRCPEEEIVDPEDDCFESEGFWRLFEIGTAPYLADLPFELDGTDEIITIFRNGFDPLPATP